MMLGGPMPVRLPYSADESMLVTRRQNKLARDIDIINQKIRNNVLSRSEGATRIRFKQSEIDELQRYKSSKRVPTGRLSPPPRRQKVVQRSGKPANKYNPYATDKVNRATDPNMFDSGEMTFNRASPDSRQKAYEKSTSWTEDDRAGFTSRGNDRADGRKPPVTIRDDTNKRGFVVADYYTRYLSNYQTLKGKNPSSLERTGMKAKAASMWSKSLPMPSKAKKSVQQQAKSAANKAKDKASSWWSRAKSSPKSSGSQDNTPKTVKSNPHGQGYGRDLSMDELRKTGGVTKRHEGVVYGPKSPDKIKDWRDWNHANSIAGFAGMPNHLIRNKSRALRDTALMRKRAGARINFDNPNMTNNTQMRKWETYTRPEEVAILKSMLPQMTGLDKFPELTPEGNAMMIELVTVGNNPKKMEIVANKLATDLMNKSGYFVKEYSVAVDPLRMKVKVSEMSGLAGGLSKTRNSMQRLLK